MTVHVDRLGAVTTVTIDRPELRNAVDRPTAEALAEAFRAFEADQEAAVAVLTGAGGTFCAGADLKAVSSGNGNRVAADGDGPMGPTRMRLSKPVIAAIEGHAVAGGLELALWADLRVAATDAVLGVFCRRWGVPLIDGGTVRLPRLIGQSRAMDLVLTGRPVDAAEALDIGLVNRLAEPGGALAAAVRLAGEIAAFPQTCARQDRLSVLGQWSLEERAGTASSEVVSAGEGPKKHTGPPVSRRGALRRPELGVGRCSQSLALRCVGMTSPSSSLTSDSRYRRWPPSVRIALSFPALAQRVTVFGSTRNIAATSAGVRRDSVSVGRVTTALPFGAFVSWSYLLCSRVCHRVRLGET